MNPSSLIDLPLRYKPWRARHLLLVLRDLAGPARQPEAEHRSHLRGAIDWLCHAQDMRDGRSDAGGVAAGWSFEDGWLPGYPETTGYIIETFLAAAPVLQRPELVERAGRMIDWELSLQAADGAFPGHFGEPGSHPVIFNQGQIMHGLVAGYTQLGRQDCLEAGLRAGRWLVAQQDADSDQQYEAIMRQLVEHMMQDSASVPGDMDIIWAARSLERIGDRSRNICEYVIYLVKGKDVRHTSLEQMAERAGFKTGKG